MTFENDLKNEFLSVYNEHISREGAALLLEWLLKTDFFRAPASTRFHLAVPGGLCQHSLGVYKRLSANTELADTPKESIAVVSLLHDLCKVNLYKESTRNVKNDITGEWEKKPFYQVEDSLPYGHGEKSVYIISGFMRLNREEAMAIRWHMGGFDDSAKAGNFTISEAFSRYPLAVHTHIADLEASYLDEERGPRKD